MEKSDGKVVVDVYANHEEDCFENSLLKILGGIDNNLRTLIDEIREDKEMKREARSTIDELQSRMENFKNNYQI
ncbi:hypothetical protein [Enterococcus mundtii]|uniref:Uncharacterized protein n=1 Tax=Enterococcus mundtii TaxID=53346 RepID=A0A1V2UH28_ENTMU|nr:hypothetical protein [Enterococcus mundtii]ONN42663.1 hypothetical protein BTN92_10365 [Enterococcus mundtii]